MAAMAARPEIVTCTVDHALPDGWLRLLGSARSVTPTLTLVETGGARLLVDCGAERDGRGFRPPEEAVRAEALLLTHAHSDHVSGLPGLLESGFSGPVLGTAATLAIARHVLADGLRLLGATEAESAAFARRLDRLARPVAYDATVEPVPGMPVTAAFREAGHLLGSASIELRSPGARVVVSGDLGRPGSPILRDFCTDWASDRPVDLVVLEATYGGRDHEVTSAEVRDLLEAAIRRALADGGHILVPSFALGRTQVLLYHLNDLVESGRLEDLPVAVDTPLGLRVTETYQRFRRLFDRESVGRIARGDDPLGFEDLYAVRRGRDSARLRDLERPMLILAGSGMCEGGRIVDHLAELLPRPETAVLFVGHQAEGTRGAALLEAARRRAAGEEAQVTLGGREVPVRAAIERIPGLSAHADRGELAAWLAAIPAPERVALCHGTPESQRALARRLSTA